MAALLLALFAALAETAPFAEAAPAPAAQTAEPAAAAAGSGAAPEPVLAASAWGRFWSFLENVLDNRRRMLQLATVGMCLALYIMMRK